jgi:hypothetical protein
MSKIFNTKRGDWQMNAFVKTFGSNSWANPAAGFQMTAEVIFKQIKKNRHTVDKYIFPLVYNSRHCMELRLKEIIDRGSKLIDKDSEIPAIHDLERLWHIAKPILLVAYPELTEDSRVPVAEIVFQEFSEHDRQSTSFRYPSDTKGNISLS